MIFVFPEAKRLVEQGWIPFFDDNQEMPIAGYYMDSEGRSPREAEHVLLPTVDDYGKSDGLWAYINKTHGTNGICTLKKALMEAHQAGFNA